MALSISEAALENSIINAVQLAGPGASEGKVKSEFYRILGLLDPDGQFRKSAATIIGVKDVYGTVIGVDKELSSNRGVIFMKTRPHPKWNPAGQDVTRSDRLEVSEARALMTKARGLVGHRARQTVVVFETDNGKVREVSDIVDLGVDSAYDAFSEDYQVNLGAANIAPAKLASRQ